MTTPRPSPPLPPRDAFDAVEGGNINSTRYDDVFNTTITPVARPQHRRSLGAIAVHPATVVSEFRVTKNHRHHHHSGRQSLFLSRNKRIKPSAKRKMTDLACLVALLLAWCGSGVIAAIAFLKGDPLLLLNNYDYMRKPCVYPNGLLVVDPRNESAWYGLGVCRGACPQAGEEVCDYNGTNCWTPSVDYQVYMFTKCVPSPTVNSVCARSPFLAATQGNFSDPRQGDLTLPQLADRMEEEDAFVVSLQISGNDPRCGECLDVGENDTWPPPDPSACPGTGAKMIDALTITTLERPPPLSGLFLDASALSGLAYRWMNEVTNSVLAVFVGGGPVALGVGFLWVAVFACISRAAIWGTLLGAVLGLAFLAYQFLLKGNAFGATRLEISNDILSHTGVDSSEVLELDIFSSQSADASSDAYAVAGWLSLALCLVLCVLGAAFRGALSRAGRIMSAASQAIFSTPALLVMPLCSFALVCALSLWFGAVFLYLVTVQRAGELSTAFSTTTREQDPPLGTVAATHTYDYLLLGSLVVLHCMVWFWTLCFVGDVFFTAVAGAVAGWHWSERDGNRGRVGGSLYRAVRYHLGSAAAGSFLVSMMYLARLALSLWRRLLGTSSGIGARQAPSTTAMPGSSLGSRLACFCGGGGGGCCFPCSSPLSGLYAALRFATKSGLVVTAVRGEGFCHSTKTAFVLMANNLAETGATALASGLVLFLGRLAVVAASCLSTWAMLSHQRDDQSGMLLPILTSGLLGYFVGGAFIDLYSAAVDTLVIVRCDDVMAKEYVDHRSGDEEEGEPEEDRMYAEMGREEEDRGARGGRSDWMEVV